MWKFCWNIWLKMCDLPLFLFLDLNFHFRSKTIDFYEVLWNFSSFIFWNLFKEICLLKIFQEIFHFHEDVFMEICHLKTCSRDFSFFIKICSWWFVLWRLVKWFFSLKIYSRDFSFFMKICSWRFIQEILPFMKMCSLRFIHWRLKCRRFIPFRRFVIWKFE